MVEPDISQSEEAETIIAASNPRHGVVPSPDWQRLSREYSPITCHPVKAGTSRLAPERELGIDLACPSALAGPSRPAQERPSGAVIPISDSDDSLRFGCQIEEAPYTTDEE